jgi:hypothetical protein
MFILEIKNLPLLMATTITWIYADRLKTNPERRHKVKGRTSFAFSDVRRISVFITALRQHEIKRITVTINGSV